jgi:hypothetical protein
MYGQRRRLIIQSYLNAIAALSCVELQAAKGAPSLSHGHGVKPGDFFEVKFKDAQSWMCTQKRFGNHSFA